VKSNPAPNYGCHNRPRPAVPSTSQAGTVLTAQSGWREYEERGHQVKVPVYVTVPYRFTTDCQYDKGTTDPRCAGCQHIKAATAA
jgi:hypothetical protein